MNFSLAEETKTTRLELIETRKSIRLAENGHKLLKQKRDVLVLEFFKILQKAKDLRADLNSQISTSFKSLALAQAFDGVFEVEATAMSVKSAPGVEVKSKNVMGVNIPDIKGESVSKTLEQRGYPIVASTARIDETAENFEKTLDLVIKLAESENALKRLIKEIEKTKRRVNALDYVLIPKLRAKARYISMRLEEMEREQFMALKTIKAKLEANT